MCRTWLKECIENGTKSWDVAIVQMLAVVLMSALNCRKGELIRSKGYTGDEYLQGEHITLRFKKDKSTIFKNLVAMVKP